MPAETDQNATHDASTSIVCPECGIRHGATLASCPWCGRAHETDAVPVAGESSVAVEALSVEEDSLQVVVDDSGVAAAPRIPAPVSAAADTGAPNEPGAPPATPPAPPPVTSPAAAAAAARAAAARAPVARSEEAEGDDTAVETVDPASGAAVEAGVAGESTAVLPKPAPSSMPPTNTGELRTIISPPPRWQRIVGTVGIGALLLVTGALIAEFAPLGSLTRGLLGASGGSGTVPTTSTSIAPTTTLPPPPPTTTTAAPSTTTTSEPPASTTTTTEAVLTGVGDPIPIQNLRLGVDSIGPLGIGEEAVEIVGRLVATFGQPIEDSGLIVSDGQLGTCEGDVVRFVRWGSLTVIIEEGVAGEQRMDAYRVDIRNSEAGDPTRDLATISGFRPGQSLGDLRATYDSFTIEITEREGSSAFELLRSQDGRLLLWGPVAGAADDATVYGIYSPDACR